MRTLKFFAAVAVLLLMVTVTIAQVLPNQPVVVTDQTIRLASAGGYTVTLWVNNTNQYVQVQRGSEVATIQTGGNVPPNVFLASPSGLVMVNEDNILIGKNGHSSRLTATGLWVDGERKF